MPRDKRKREKQHEPIAVQMSNDRTLEHARKRVKRSKQKGSQAAESAPMGKKMSDKVLKLAAEQMEEEEWDAAGSSSSSAAAPLGGMSQNYLDDDDEDVDEEDEFSETEEDYVLDYEVESASKLSEADERALAMFMSKNAPQRQTLADVMQRKMDERAGGDAAMGDAGQTLDSRVEQSLDPKFVELFSAVGKILHKYSAGKLPKAFKVMPVFKNWEELLYLTKPDEWSPCAVYQGTKIFSSGTNDDMAQRFYGLVLVPRVRDDIKEHKKLNYHLYQSLKRALYKPSAFFKAVVFPMCEDGDSTLREAIIVSSVLRKASVPWAHAAAALTRIAQLQRYSGATSIFLRALLDKKYALPPTTVDAVARHFISFRDETRELPVLWHQALYVFAQRYKTTLTRAQKEEMKLLMRVHTHAQITPLVRNELFTSAARDDPDRASPAEHASSSSSGMSFADATPVSMQF